MTGVSEPPSMQKRGICTFMNDAFIKTLQQFVLRQIFNMLLYYEYIFDYIYESLHVMKKMSKSANDRNSKLNVSREESSLRSRSVKSL